MENDVLKHKLPAYSSKNLIVLYRYVYSKFQYQTHTVTSEDMFIANFAFLDIMKLARQDSKFRKKNLERIMLIASSIVKINTEYELHEHTSKPPEVCYFPKKTGTLEFSPRAFLGLQTAPDFQRIYKNATVTKVLRTRFPEKSRIGVGYRDKGSRRITSEDGSATWQEVASNQVQTGSLFKHETVEETISRLIVENIETKLYRSQGIICSLYEQYRSIVDRPARPNVLSKEGKRALYKRGVNRLSKRYSGSTFQ